ncbi:MULTISPECIES: SDR family oxidoreductase [unclassified Saccharibacter]|uniref:SDR family oxidoreductase n=1 Tax=unclassified Saccharibacter TaxID=2648722 RepID=UPI001EF066EA|nr:MULTISPECIES: SDR family oxidoreductase [unclassified Saccharibacter]
MTNTRRDDIHDVTSSSQMTTREGASPVGRRALLSGMTALGSLSALSSAQAAKKAVSTTSAEAAPLQDPVHHYPSPPFHQPLQSWPGLQSSMTPRPDCGEKSYKGAGRLSGRKALITGGDSGIGRAVAIAYAREGADIAINYLPKEESDAQEVAALMRKAGRQVALIPGDLREETFCQTLVHNAVKQLGGLDILVNNAGRQHYCEDILELTTEEFDWTLKTNIYALFWLVKAAVPHLPKGATIINTASRNAYAPNPILVDYAMTKAGIANMTHSLARQLLPRGIRVNAVAPGPFWTPLQVCGAQPQSVVEHFGSETAYHRPGQPVEIAPMYVTLASQESSYVTGQVWGITGGDGSPG